MFFENGGFLEEFGNSIFEIGRQIYFRNFNFRV